VHTGGESFFEDLEWDLHDVHGRSAAKTSILEFLDGEECATVSTRVGQSQLLSQLSRRQRHSYITYLGGIFEVERESRTSAPERASEQFEINETVCAYMLLRKELTTLPRCIKKTRWEKAMSRLCGDVKIACRNSQSIKDVKTGEGGWNEKNLARFFQQI